MDSCFLGLFAHTTVKQPLTLSSYASSYLSTFSLFAAFIYESLLITMFLWNKYDVVTCYNSFTTWEGVIKSSRSVSCSTPLNWEAIFTAVKCLLFTLVLWISILDSTNLTINHMFLDLSVISSCMDLIIYFYLLYVSFSL